MIKTALAATAIAAVASTGSVEDLKVALLGVACLLIFSVGRFIVAAIDNQTERLLQARGARRTRILDPQGEE